MYMRCTSFIANFLRQVGHFFCAEIAPRIQLWQKICPHTVDDSIFIESKHIAHINLSSFSFSASLGGSTEAISFLFRLCKTINRVHNIIRAHCLTTGLKKTNSDTSKLLCEAVYFDMAFPIFINIRQEI